MDFPYSADIPLERLRKNVANPNEMSAKDFNALAASIDEEGWVQPMASVVPIGAYDENDPFGWAEFSIVGGHHRFDYAVLRGDETGPCWVLDPAKFDEDRQLWNMTKLNIVHGRLNPEKFTRLWQDMAARYDAETLQGLMGFTDEDAFRKVVKTVRQALPPELAAKLDEVKDEIKTIDGLSLVLNKLFREYGESLPSNVMAFSFAGKEVMWILADKRLWTLVSSIRKEVVAAGGDMAATLSQLLEEARATGASAA